MKKLLALIAIITICPVNVWAFTVNTYSTALVEGSNQYWSIADASQSGLDITGDMTIAGWVNTLNAPSSWNNGYISLAGKIDFSSGPAKSYWFGANWNGGTSHSIFHFLISDGTESDSTQNFASEQSAGTWYHIAVTYTAAGGSVQFYLNGSANGSAVTGARTSITNSSTAFTIGTALNSGSPTRNSSMSIDDVRIWSRALTSQEISDLYTTPCTFTNGASIVSMWLFENDGVDSVGSNNLTNNNSATFTTPAYACPASASANAGIGGFMRPQVIQ